MNHNTSPVRIYAQEIQFDPDQLDLWHASSTVFTARMKTLLFNVVISLREKIRDFSTNDEAAFISDDEVRQSAGEIADKLERDYSKLYDIEKALRDMPHPDMPMVLNFERKISNVATSIKDLLAGLSDFYYNIISTDDSDPNSTSLNTSWKLPWDSEDRETIFDTPLPPEPHPPTPEDSLTALIEVATSKDPKLNVSDLIAAFGGARCERLLVTLPQSLSVDNIIVSMAAGIEALKELLDGLQTDGRLQDPTLKTVTEDGIHYGLMTIDLVMDLAEISPALLSWQEILQRIKNKHPSIVGGNRPTRVGRTDNYHCLFALALPISALKGADTIPLSWLDGVPDSNN